MKKVILGLFVFLSLLFFTGCTKYTEKDIVKDLEKNLNKAKAYKLEGVLEILNNDDVYNYDVEVSFKRDDLYKVSLRNKANNHEQIILKNKEGVFILTPSLNKSFKFQSDWPYSNSQIYLLQSVIDDITNDKTREFKELKDGYQFTTVVNYPNNRKLVKQVVLFDKKLNLKEIKVLNEEGVPQMRMKFKNIDYSPTFKKDYFKLEEIMESANIMDSEDIPVGNLDDSIYPLVLPNGTKLTNEEKIKMENGQRVIMTFDGEKPFLLVQETVNIEDELVVIPTYGEPYMLIDTLGAITNNSITWSSNGIEYYIVSDVLSQNELIEVASSLNVIPTMK